MLNVVRRVLSDGCAGGVTLGCDSGAAPLHRGHCHHCHGPQEERQAADQGVHRVTDLRVRLERRQEGEVALQRPVEPAAEEVITRREAGQPHDARGVAKRIEYDHQAGAEIATGHEAGEQPAS